MLSKRRLEYRPIIPNLLENLSQVEFKKEGTPHVRSDSSVTSGINLRSLFPKTFESSPFSLQKGLGKKRGPLKIGALFSGGQASGGHNVLIGIFHALKTFDPNSQLLGFLNGPSGVIENKRKNSRRKKSPPISIKEDSTSLERVVPKLKQQNNSLRLLLPVKKIISTVLSLLEEMIQIPMLRFSQNIFSEMVVKQESLEFRKQSTAI